MIPQSYRIALAALDALWRCYPIDALGTLLGGMEVNSDDQDSMDPGALFDWNQIVGQSPGVGDRDLILAYLSLDASRYRIVPQELLHLIRALYSEGSAERRVLDEAISEYCARG